MTTAKPFDPVSLLAQECNLPAKSVQATVDLLAAGSTVPFIARYRKEVTGNLDEVQIRTIEERRMYLMELDERRRSVIASITEQGKMTDKLQAMIAACQTKSGLEDLYLPFKPKRRTRATIAKERGLEPLAELILAQPHLGDPTTEAEAYVKPDKEVNSPAEALAGAGHIIAELVAEDAQVRAAARATYQKQGVLKSERIEDKTQQPTKFEQYYAFSQECASIPSHRFLAIRRGEREGFLKVHIELEPAPVIDAALQVRKPDPASAFAPNLTQAVIDGCVRLLMPSVETDVRVELKMRADREAVDVFASNLRNLLLAAPLGEKSVVGIDPGLRTGCKCVALSNTGRFLGNTTFYLTRGDKALPEAAKEFLSFVKQHAPSCVAIGNGTGGRETETFVRQVLAQAQLTDIVVVAVNEAGASVYSASDTAREEFPDLDLTLRGAISIGRRLQDPLAELVKIDPKAIGVGQYQHDVHQALLARKLDEVVESCVNHVGVEVNTASAPLLARVAGIGPALAKKIVSHRESTGPYPGREALRDIPGMGPRTFEQAAGFLRLRGGSHPLDASAVHPERYTLVEKMATDLHVELSELLGNATLAERIDVPRYVDDSVGEPTLRDIISELQKPGRDPRAAFSPPRFRDDVHELSQLVAGMEFEGVVTNVTAFGAFVDIGVHQDGLVHISALSERFVKDPHEVVKVGDKIKVAVTDVDIPRKRIGLTARLTGTKVANQSATPKDDTPRNARSGQPNGQGKGRGPSRAPPKFSNNPFAQLKTR